jgi:hypothetical protein
MALYQRGRVDDRELVSVLQDLDVRRWRDGNYGKDRTLRLPAFRAAASMVVGNIALDADFHRIACAIAY